MLFSAIKKGDIIDVIFPATCVSVDQISKIKHYIHDTIGATPRIIMENETTPAKNADNEFPSFSAEKRFEQLYQALKADDSKIIWCARGGYGSGDLLPFLAKAKKIKQNKIFIGFSDITSIATFLQQEWGWSILCAPVLTQLINTEISESEVELKNLIFGTKNIFHYRLENKNHFTKSIAGSEIIGGCISVLAGHFGSKYQVNFKNKILFLEDEGEDGERLDRYFRQIIEVILSAKEKPAAILLGNFLEANLHGTPKAENIKIAIDRLIQRIDDFNLQIPVFESKDKNLGHSKNMRPLLLGVKCDISHSADSELIIKI